MLVLSDFKAERIQPQQNGHTMRDQLQISPARGIVGTFVFLACPLV